MARLGEMLLRERLVNEAQLAAAIEEDKKAGRGLPAALTHTGVVSEEKLLAFLSRQFRVPQIFLKLGAELDKDLAKLVPEEMARKHRVVALGRHGANLRVAIADPSNIFAVDDLKFFSGLSVDLSVASPSDL